jgi:hypothetical protein
MADRSKAAAGEPSKNIRRESERSGHSRSNQTGRGRESDRTRTQPRRNVAKIAIACSFLFSLSLVAWAFTLPFRSGGLSTEGDLRDLPEVELANLEYEARLSSQGYVDYARDLDRDLLDQVHEKYRLDGPEPPSTRELRQKWKERVRQSGKQLQKMREEGGGRTFEKGTIEWENQREFEKILDDPPPGI